MKLEASQRVQDQGREEHRDQRASPFPAVKPGNRKESKTDDRGRDEKNSSGDSEACERQPDLAVKDD
jgi:hypothetical protein